MADDFRKQHERTLKEHDTMLRNHVEVLKQHDAMLIRIDKRLDKVGDRLIQINKSLDRTQAIVAKLAVRTVELNVALESQDKRIVKLEGGE